MLNSIDNNDYISFEAKIIESSPQKSNSETSERKEKR